MKEKPKKEKPTPKNETTTFRDLLKASNLKYKDIARSLNYTPNTISKRRKNPGKMTVDEMIAISHLLGRTPYSVCRAIIHDVLSNPYIDTDDVEEEDEE